jgi:hypothetical protein
MYTDPKYTENHDHFNCLKLARWILDAFDWLADKDQDERLQISLEELHEAKNIANFAFFKVGLCPDGIESNAQMEEAFDHRGRPVIDEIIALIKNKQAGDQTSQSSSPTPPPPSQQQQQHIIIPYLPLNHPQRRTTYNY